jgi:hypothetical protein
MTDDTTRTARLAGLDDLMAKFRERLVADTAREALADTGYTQPTPEEIDAKVASVRAMVESEQKGIMANTVAELMQREFTRRRRSAEELGNAMALGTPTGLQGLFPSLKRPAGKR